ncbi:Peptide deformylase [Dermatophilus congolensis]|uniref:Peptide deformylase n=2 Tax=Dermatophilus congolensis TaxID=1863 RepID=A0A239V9M4_9MICO|nr:Peptide deformylase [Dermatophilus congolensis]STD15455.1 Peptide deformylase [Dermatophilus congolensis]
MVYMCPSFSSFGSFSRDQSRSSSLVGGRDSRPRFMGEPVNKLPDPLVEVRRGKRLRITVRGESVLHEPAADVTDFGSKELRELVNDMFATMECANGVGLAATQVGVGLRLFVYDCPDAYEVRHVGHMCNPTYTVLDEDETVTDKEGCLSVPGAFAELTRPTRVRADGFDIRGNPIHLEGVGLFARCLQHEIDHLNGILYVDHLDEDALQGALAESDEKRHETWQEWDENAEDLGKSTGPEVQSANPPATA